MVTSSNNESPVDSVEVDWRSVSLVHFFQSPTKRVLSILIGLLPVSLFLGMGVFLLLVGALFLYARKTKRRLDDYHEPVIKHLYAYLNAHYRLGLKFFAITVVVTFVALSLMTSVYVPAISVTMALGVQGVVIALFCGTCFWNIGRLYFGLTPISSLFLIAPSTLAAIVYFPIRRLIRPPHKIDEV
ncbi:hypothetical protein QTV44_002579 [Vibrio vulnificus]|nr:hypothetical protein [Vibrio vulnificus]